jgi:hypothetical protein
MATAAAQCKSDGQLLSSRMADDAAKPETREFPVIVTVDGVRVEVILTLKSTAVVADVQTKVVTDQPDPPRDDH